MKKLVMIGCGGIGWYHLEHFLEYTDVELAGFCDLIPERAEQFVEKAGKGKAYTDFRVMYDEISPDMVFICVPPYKHGDIEFETIERGIHLFVEKPVTLDLELAHRIRDGIAAKGLISASGFQCRYDNINDAAKDYIGKNVIVAAQGSRIGGIPGTDWWNKKSLSGGQLVEQAVHQCDIMRYLLGEPDTVYSVARRGIVNDADSPGYDTDDVSTTIVTFKSGLSWTMITGCYSQNGASWDSKITLGSRASRMDYNLCSNVTIYGVDEKDIAGEAAGVIQGDGTQRRNENEVGVKINSAVDFGVLCDRTFVDAVISGDASKIRSPYADAVKTLALVLACNESMETGKPVKISL